MGGAECNRRENEESSGSRKNGTDREVMELVLITGMSGAGRTIVLRRFEDLGYYCIDNLPPALLPAFARLSAENPETKRVAVVIDLRAGAFFDRLPETVQELKDSGLSPFILFLDAGDEALVRRFKETRRKHPLFSRRQGILESIRAERARLEEARSLADKVIDTSAMAAKDLRAEIAESFPESDSGGATVTVRSFGFKHGIPLDADLVFDVRHLVNPHYVSALRELDGRNEEIVRYVESDPNTKIYMEKLKDLLGFSLPRYIAEGKAYLTLAIGCTGGKHRSVMVAEQLGEFLAAQGYHVLVRHRDVSKGG
jgi:UPF0042 nucleotide-binding protein